MGENLHDIDKLFKEGLDSHQEAPAPALWDSIEKNLDKEDTERLRRHNRLLKRGALVLLVFLSISLIFLYQYSNNNNKSDITKEPATKAPVINSNTPESHETVEKSEPTATTIDPSNEEKENKRIKKESKSPETLTRNSPEKKDNNSANTKQVETENKKTKAIPLNTRETASSETIKRKKGTTETTTALTLKRNKKLLDKSSAPSIIKKEVLPEDFATVKQKKNLGTNKESVTYSTQKERNRSRLTESNKKVVNPITSYKEELDERNIATAKIISINLLERKEIKPSGSIRNIKDISLQAGTTIIKPSLTHIPAPSSFTLSLYYSPNINIQQVQDGERKHMEDDRNRIAEGEKVKSSASYGIAGSYSFNRKWAVQVGVNIFKQTSVIDPKNLFARHDDRRGNPPNSGELKYKFNCAAGYVFLDPKTGTTPAFGDSITALRSENTLSYTGIPVTVQYSTTLGKFKLNAVAGIGFNILSKSTLQSNYIAATGVKTQSVDPVQGLKSMYASGIIGAGIEYPLSGRLSAYVLPNLNFSISPINQNTPALTKLNTFGIQTGLKFRL